jgi:putative ABC transport system permease protein
VPGVLAAAPALRGTGQVVNGNLNWSTVIYGVTPEYLTARDWPVARGRALDESDVRASAKVALVGQTVAQMLFGGTDPTGQTIRVKYVPFTIVGLLEAKGQSYMGQDQDDVVLIPINTARGRILGQAQGRLRSVGHINMKMADGVDMKRPRPGARTVAPAPPPATGPGRRFQHPQPVRSRQGRAGRFRRALRHCSRRSPRCRCWSAASAS